MQELRIIQASNGYLLKSEIVLSKLTDELNKETKQKFKERSSKSYKKK